MTNGGPVVYFVREWPAPSEAFIREEVRTLLAQGHEIMIWSVRGTGQGENREALEPFKGRTRILWPPRWGSFLAALVGWFLRKPGLFAWFFWRVVCGEHPNFLQRVKSLVHVAVGGYAAHLLEREIQPSRLHAHFAYSGALVARVAAALLGIRYSLTVHHSDILFPQGLMDLKLGAADPLVVTSEFLRRNIVRTWPDLELPKLMVIYSGVDTLKFVPLEERGKYEGPVHLLTVARMVPNKDPLGLITVAKELRKAGLDFSWRWIGDGPLMSEARSTARDAGVEKVMELRGWVSHREMQRHYAWADIFVLGSRSEGMPFVLMEAMSSGLAVVSTSVSGIPELITSGEHGLLVSADSPHAVAEAVARLIRDPEECLRLGHAARERVRRDFDLATNAQRLWTSFMKA